MYEYCSSFFLFSVGLFIYALIWFVSSNFAQFYCRYLEYTLSPKNLNLLIKIGPVTAKADTVYCMSRFCLHISDPETKYKTVKSAPTAAKAQFVCRNSAYFWHSAELRIQTFLFESADPTFQNLRIRRQPKIH